MKGKKPISKALLALTASALNIPGMMPAAHAQPTQAGDAFPTRTADEMLLDYRYSAYREGDIPASKTNAQSGQRFDVDTHEFRVTAPLGSATDLTGDVTYEAMSGATIKDDRQALQLRADHRFAALTGSLVVGYSTERDYHTANIGLEGSRDFNDRLTTVSGGIGYANDRLDPTEGQSARFPTRITHASRYEANAFVGVSQVLTASTVVQTSFDYTTENGYLSDPYKLAYVDGNLLQDARPHNRREWAWTTRLRQDVAAANAAVHLDYRFFGDEWNIVSHTVDLAWYQSLPDRWALVPRARWYSQSQASYYAPYYNATRSDGFYSSDYRLSPYGSLSLSVGAYKQLATWNISLRYEHYSSGAGYSVRSVDVENPGLVKFQVFSVGLAKTF